MFQRAKTVAAGSPPMRNDTNGILGPEMEDLPIKRLECVQVKKQLRLFTGAIGQGYQALTPVLTNLLFHLLLLPLKVLLDRPGKASLSVVVYHQGQA